MPWRRATGWRKYQVGASRQVAQVEATATDSSRARATTWRRRWNQAVRRRRKKRAGAYLPLRPLNLRSADALIVPLGCGGACASSRPGEGNMENAAQLVAAVFQAQARPGRTDSRLPLDVLAGLRRLSSRTTFAASQVASGHRAERIESTTWLASTPDASDRSGGVPMFSRHIGRSREGPRDLQAVDTRSTAADDRRG